MGRPPGLLAWLILPPPRCLLPCSLGCLLAWLPPYTHFLFSLPADKQFYPELVEKGAQLLKVDVTPEGLKLDQVHWYMACSTMHGVATPLRQVPLTRPLDTSHPLLRPRPGGRNPRPRA